MQIHLSGIGFRPTPRPRRKGMEPLIYDIEEKIACNKAMLDGPMSKRERWLVERETARLVWRRDARAHRRRTGGAAYDCDQWRLDRACAQAAFAAAARRARKRAGDAEILSRLELKGREDPCCGAYRLTPARRKVIAAVVRLASDSGMLYCGYDGLARAARVSPRTACAVRAELERDGVLKRVRTGGRSADGVRQSNRYVVKWGALRDLLGIESRWGELDNPNALALWLMPRNSYYNYEGCAHYSRSERQKRRLAKREREARIIGSALRVSPDFVENPSGGLPATAGAHVENSENGMPEQGFCALTTLKIFKDQHQPGRHSLLVVEPNVEKAGARQSRAQDGGPADRKDLCFSTSRFGKANLSLLADIDPRQTPYLLAEIDQMTRSNPTLSTEHDRQSHAESLFELFTDGHPRHLFP